MIVKCSKEWVSNTVIITLIGVVCVFAGIMKFGITKIGVFYMVSMICFLCWNGLKTWVTVGRTFIFDKNGITVKLLRFSKTYKWEELKTKRIEDYSERLRINQPYNGAAVFSPKIIRNPFKLYPIYYSMFAVPFINSFKYVFVYFDPYTEQNKKDERDMPYTYMVNESEFRDCMRDWNVDIENLE